MGVGGSPTLHMTDRTVMALNPDSETDRPMQTAADHASR